MKSTIFRKVLKEEYIEVNKSVSETIEHLRELEGSNHERLPDNVKILFICSKKGKITVEYYVPSHRRRDIENSLTLYVLSGKVIFENDKTYIKTTAIYKRYNLFLQIFLKILAILILPLYILIEIPLGVLTVPIFLITFAIGIAIIADSGPPIPQQKSRGLTLIPFMENEIKKRVELIEQWDDFES